MGGEKSWQSSCISFAWWWYQQFAQFLRLLRCNCHPFEWCFWLTSWSWFLQRRGFLEQHVLRYQVLASTHKFLTFAEQSSPPYSFIQGRPCPSVFWSYGVVTQSEACYEKHLWKLKENEIKKWTSKIKIRKKELTTNVGAVLEDLADFFINCNQLVALDSDFGISLLHLWQDPLGKMFWGQSCQEVANKIFWQPIAFNFQIRKVSF